jgi:ribose transport system permease protein
MIPNRIPAGIGVLASRFFSDYGILAALVLLCGYFSWVTYTVQRPTGATGGSELAEQIRRTAGNGAAVLIVTRDNREDLEFAEALGGRLSAGGGTVVGTVRGEPADARKALERLATSGARLDVIACNEVTARWAVFDNLASRYPALSGARLMTPSGFRGSSFLKTDNLLNVANQIAVIAIIAIGMTMVVITGGIDLSVGSLIALSAVVATLLIRRMGAEQAGVGSMVAASAAAVGLCGGVGLLSGALVAFCRIPSFIATLGMMLVASGLAFIFAQGQSIYQVPDSFVWLGRGADLRLPNAVVLMLLLYGLAHAFMTRTRFGRYLYAVGSNARAAQLSGVPVARVQLLVYTVSALLAGLGGVVMASQLKSGAPTYGQMYELVVIAAVVVGGTSLGGGEGKVFGTLIGAFLIAVIQNGMNLTGVESYTQKVVLGGVILGAVLLDRWRTGGARRWLRQ